MDDVKRELAEFITVLNAECVKLAKKGRMYPPVREPWRLYAPSLSAEEAWRYYDPHPGVHEPWRYYSPPMDDEHEHDHLRAVLEAGRHTVEAEQLLHIGDKQGAWRSLALAQGALLKSLSARGRAEAKKAGNASGGGSKSEEIHERVFCIADDLLSAGHKWRGLPTKVADKLADGRLVKKVDDIRVILNLMRHELLIDRRIHHISNELVTGAHTADEVVKMVVAQLNNEKIKVSDAYVQQNLEPFLKHLQVNR